MRRTTRSRELRVFAAAALLAGAVAIPGGWACAQPAGTGDDLRPLIMTSQDARDGRASAALACASCHGAEGVSAKDGAPNLAGQRPVFLYKVLKAWRLGAPGVSSGSHDARLLKPFTDDALASIAAYYAGLDPAPSADGPAAPFDDVYALGKTAARPCGKCHGEAGVSRKDGVPNLIGLHPKYFVDALKAYRDGDRKLDDKNQEMLKAVNTLNDRDIDNVALYFAAQSEKLTRAQTAGLGVSPAGKDAVAACVKCHGADGIGTGPVNPNLAGQDATYLVNALRAYKSGARDDDTMARKVQALSDDDLKALAAYYSALDPKPLGILRPLSADEWAEKCDRCHGLNGNSVRPEVPALAAQRTDYLEAALKAYRSGARTSPEMAAMTSILTDDDIKGLAAHYARQKGRAVVFVPVPAP